MFLSNIFGASGSVDFKSRGRAGGCGSAAAQRGDHAASLSRGGQFVTHGQCAPASAQARCKSAPNSVFVPARPNGLGQVQGPFDQAVGHRLLENGGHASVGYICEQLKDPARNGNRT
jgi:hypothetical protein